MHTFSFWAPQHPKNETTNIMVPTIINPIAGVSYWLSKNIIYCLKNPWATPPIHIRAIPLNWKKKELKNQLNIQLKDQRLLDSKFQIFYDGRQSVDIKLGVLSIKKIFCHKSLGLGILGR